ncbi:MAG: DUF1345 domain-containing protein [Verrucomicrobia bacterium]|nr:DUF1345 domain-containing protein [Verrucomicrobiota bacterium]
MFFLFHRIKSWDAHHRLLASAGGAVLVAIATQGSLRLPVQVVTVWNAFCLCILALAWLRIITARPLESLKTAKLQDSSRRTIFVFVLLAACASIFAVGYLLGTAHGRHGGRLLETVALAFATVIGSWSLIHTVFALHYAHIYYGDSGDPHQARHAAGLLFPDEPNPDYLDFAYFSFVIGMTCQVSDVQVSGRRLRRWTLVHGLLSFAFNTAILALSINVVSSLFTG